MQLDELIHLPHLTACGTILGYIHQIVAERGVSIRTLDEPGFVRFQLGDRHRDCRSDAFIGVDDDQLRVIAQGIASQIRPATGG